MGYAQLTPSPTNSATSGTGLAATPASAGLVNDWLRDQAPELKAWDFGGQLRVRWEHKEYYAAPGQPGAVDFRKVGGNPDNTYLLLRETVHLGYQGDWFGGFVEGRGSSSTGDDRNPNLESNAFDLHQAYLTLGNKEQFPLVGKVGRQEISYGDERLVGAFDWNNIGRSFDAVKLNYSGKDFWVDGFVSRVVIPTDNHFDVSNDYDTLSGLYGSSTSLVPWQETQLYFFSRNTGKGSPNLQTGALVPLASPRDIYTMGFRVKSKPGQLNGFDYGVEGAFQLGRYVGASGTAPNAVIGKSLDQEAYAGHLEGGYTFAKAWAKPRLGVELNYASGDDNSSDTTHGTFDQMFPTGHKFSGIMDFYSWQNVEDARVSLTLKPAKAVTLVTSYRGVWLATTADSFYQVNTAARSGGTTGGHNGYAVNPSYGSFVGTEFDLTLNYAITPYAAIQGGYGHFFVGDYIKQSLSAIGGAHDADYIYLQTTLNF